MSRKNTSMRDAGAATKEPNPYAAPASSASLPKPGEPVGEPRNASVHFGHLSGAFKVASRQQGTWLLILLLMPVIAVVLLLGATIVAGIASTAVDSALIAMNAPQFILDGSEAFLAFLLTSAFGAFLLGGLFTTACKQVRGERIRVRDLFGAVGVFGQVTLAVILIELLTSAALFAVLAPFMVLPTPPEAVQPVLAVIIGLALIVVYGVVTGRLMLVVPLVVDGKQTAVAAIRKSWVALRGRTIAAIVFNVLAAVCSGLGAILLVIGLLLTLPVYYVAVAMVYHDFFRGEADYAA